MKDKFYNFFTIVSEYSLYGLLFFIPISNTLIEIFAAILLVSFVGRKLIKPDFSFIKFWPNIFLLLFLLFNILSLLNSGEFFKITLHAIFGKWLQYLGICIIIQDYTYDHKIVKRCAFVFLFSAFLAVLSGLSQYFFGVEFLRHRSMTVLVGGARAITSSFAHYNGFGGYLAVVISLISAFLLANNSSRFRTALLVVFAVFSTVAIILTFSRGSWLALIISFIFMCILAKKNLKWLIPIFLVIVVMSLYPAFHERLLFSFRAQGDNDRFKYWQAAFKMIMEHPFFGMGAGTFMSNFPKYLIGKPLYAHNCYLQICAETGIFSLISFVEFILFIVYFGVKKFLDSKDFLLLGLLSGFVSFLVHIFFDTGLYSLQLAFLFWAWAGLIIARLHTISDE